MTEGTAATEGNVLAAVVGADAVLAAVGEIIPHRVGEVADQKDNVSDAGLAQPLYLMPEDGTAEQGNHGFRHVVGEGTKSFALSAGEDESVHGGGMLMRQSDGVNGNVHYVTTEIREDCAKRPA